MAAVSITALCLFVVDTVIYITTHLFKTVNRYGGFKSGSY